MRTIAKSFLFLFCLIHIAFKYLTKVVSVGPAVKISTKKHKTFYYPKKC